MYTLETVNDDNDDDQADDGGNIEGHLERLPPGKKKSTIWNSWKRQYFVAKNGLLLIFADNSRQVLMDRIELAGGRVDFVGAVRGQSAKVREAHDVPLLCVRTRVDPKALPRLDTTLCRNSVTPVFLIF